MKRLNWATTATVGCATALVTVAAASTAGADELQLNQQLLNQRVDQLAAVGLAPDVFGVSHNPAAGSPVTAGSFPRSILIPGTDTSLKVYGQITEILDYFLTGGNPNASPQSTTVGNNGQVLAIPLRNTVQRARSNGIFLQSPRESRIGFETRTPTPFGEARTVMEWDWAGSTTFAPGGAELLRPRRKRRNHRLWRQCRRTGPRSRPAGALHDAGLWGLGFVVVLG